MRFTCRLCPTHHDTAGHLLNHVNTVHHEMGDMPTKWPVGWDVLVETAVGQDVTHTKAWRREDFRT